MASEQENSDRERLQVLLIGEDVGDLSTVQRIVANCDISCDLTRVSDPDSARQLIASRHFDCLLLNHRLPQGDALELFGEIFLQPCSQRPPIVMLTGTQPPTQASECVKRGAQEYLSTSDLSAGALRIAIRSACQQARDASVRREMDQQLVRMSMYDCLTRLPNRALLQDRIEQQVRESARTQVSFMVLMMDLNLFKPINDTYGHDAGDELLIQVGGRIVNCLRESDSVARLRGDEFAALLLATDSIDDALVVAEKIRVAIGEPFTLQQGKVNIGVSIGAAIYPEHGDTPETLMRHADKAMYEAKSNDLEFKVYNPQSEDASNEQALIASGLKRAVSENQLLLHYQPQVCLRTGDVLGYEALVRWHHPQLGLLPPSKFLPVAERSEVMEAMTMQVIRMALRQLVGLTGTDDNRTISVNVSAQVLHRHNLVDFVRQELQELDIEPRRLCLEITETAIVRSHDTAAEILGELSGMGVLISIDDFGSGYSSLKYLRMFPTDELKMDREFIGILPGEMQDSTIVETILSIGQTFGVRVVAEGVESSRCLAQLRTWNCDRAQGYLIARPMPPLELARWHREWPERWRKISKDADAARKLWSA